MNFSCFSINLKRINIDDSIEINGYYERDELNYSLRTSSGHPPITNFCSHVLFNW
jgi:hypothetical protein